MAMMAMMAMGSMLTGYIPGQETAGRPRGQRAMKK
jgi:hypothetical protein